MIGRILRHKRSLKSQHGFTLIEVLVSLVLLSLVLALLTGAVRFAHGTWDAAVKLDREAGFDAATFVRARLGEAVPLFEPTETGIVRVAFKGDSDSVSFVAPTQNGPSGAGLYRFVLELGSPSRRPNSRPLLVRLAPYQPRQRGEPPNPPPLTDHVLAENVRTISFRYYGRKDIRSQPAWYTAWPRTDALPDLVEMTITPNGGEGPAPLIIELRLRQRT